MSWWPTEAEKWVDRDGVRVYPDQAANAAELIERSVVATPAARAVMEAGGRSLTYEQLWDESGRVAGGLQSHAVEPGDRVAFLMANCIELIVGVLAVWRVGAVAATLNTKYTRSELHGLIEHCGPRLVLAQKEWAPKVEWHGGVVTDLAALRGRHSPVDVQPDAPALVMYTSGTTGLPKGALQSHLNLVSAVETWRRCAEIEPAATTVVAAPMFHATGLNGQSLPVLAGGGRVTIMPRFDAHALADHLAAGEATFFHAAPTLYTLTLRAAGGRLARGLRTCIAGGSFVGRPLVDAALSFAPGADFRISYGMTETSSPAVLTPPGQILDRPGDAIGVAVPLDDVATDATGEILFRGATVIRGYDRNPEADALAYRNGWLRSGDLGSIGDDGFVTVSDRIKDIVNRGAEKISTLEVEDVLCAHPAVVEAAVVAAPDDLYGEVPHAFVVADGALDGRELRAFAGERLARFKVPSRVSFVEELPRNPGGKVLKNLLRERLSA